MPAAQSATDFDAMAVDVIKRSFRDQGQAKIAWLEQDAVLKACSSLTPPTEAQARQIERDALATIKWPSDGKYLGNWKTGEQIAQSGRGMTWSDKAEAPAGGGCYNCHQLSKQEISFGTIGPSLYNYGKLRGVTDPASAAAKPIVEYTWGKVWNSKAYNACSNMPRAGHMGILTQAQVADILALLLDPKSPVNQ